MKKLLFMGLFALLCSCTYAQMSQFKALYIYNFAKNIGWPDGSTSSELVITVIGDNELHQELTKLAKTKMIGSRKVVVKESATAQGIGKSDIVYLGESKSGQIGTLVNSQAANNALIVSGKDGQCAMGAGISFVAAGGKLNFQISNRNIKKHGLQVAQKLLTLGTEVD